MREGITVEVRAADRARLAAIVGDRNSRQKHVWRARIVLLTAGAGASEIMRQAGTSKLTVWRWQERFMQAGIEGLLRDKTRPARIAPLGAAVTSKVVALTQGDPPGEARHWTAEMMAKAVGISPSSVQRIWRAHGLQVSGAGSPRCAGWRRWGEPAWSDRGRGMVCQVICQLMGTVSVAWKS